MLSQRPISSSPLLGGSGAASVVSISVPAASISFSPSAPVIGETNSFAISIPSLLITFTVSPPVSADTQRFLIPSLDLNLSVFFPVIRNPLPPGNYDILQLPQWDVSKITPRPLGKDRYSSNLTLRIRFNQSTVKSDIQLFHGLLTQGQIDLFDEFYANNKNRPFTLTTVEDGVSRQVWFNPQKPFSKAGKADKKILTAYFREM